MLASLLDLRRGLLTALPHQPAGDPHLLSSSAGGGEPEEGDSCLHSPLPWLSTFPRSTPRCSHPVSSTYCASFCLLLGHHALSLHFSTGTFQGLWEEVLHLLTKSEPGFVGSFSVFSLVVSQLHCTWYSCNFMFICRL